MGGEKSTCVNTPTRGNQNTMPLSSASFVKILMVLFFLYIQQIGLHGLCSNTAKSLISLGYCYETFLGIVSIWISIHVRETPLKYRWDIRRFSFIKAWSHFSLRKLLLLQEIKWHLMGLFTLSHFPKPFCFIYCVLSQWKWFGDLKWIHPAQTDVKDEVHWF